MKIALAQMQMSQDMESNYQKSLNFIREAAEKECTYMKYTKLGNSELTVSRICMGCMGFGDSSRGQHSWTIDEEHSREIIKRGLELGVNFYDTAIAYQSGTI